jgi:hypothetical protein
LVEVEDWNEYGELKQHVTMYYDEFTTPSKAAAAKQIPSKLISQNPQAQAQAQAKVQAAEPANQKENVKPTPAPAATAEKKEEVKAPAGGQPTSFTLAMRQVGQEAAAKAKEVKKKVEPFVGLGTAEPKPETAKEEAEAEAGEETKKPPTVNEIETETSLQSPTSTAWKTPSSTASKLSLSLNPFTPHEVETLASLQSPNSTAWKSFPEIVTTHRGSTIKQVSPEEIKRVEEECKIPEEDEEEDEED